MTLGADAAPVNSCLADWRDMRAGILAHQGVPANARLFANLTADLVFRAAWVRIGSVAVGTELEEEFQQLSHKVLNSPMPDAHMLVAAKLLRIKPEQSQSESAAAPTFPNSEECSWRRGTGILSSNCRQTNKRL